MYNTGSLPLLLMIYYFDRIQQSSQYQYSGPSTLRRSGRTYDYVVMHIAQWGSYTQFTGLGHIVSEIRDVTDTTMTQGNQGLHYQLMNNVGVALVNIPLNKGKARSLYKLATLVRRYYNHTQLYQSLILYGTGP
jgi:hypothetical protein